MAKKPVDIAAVLGAQLGKVSDLDTSREQLVYIDIDQIDDDPNNFYSLTELEALASNIHLCGLQQPIRVRRGEGDRFTIVSGHRRRAALRLLVEEGLERFRAVPCIEERGDASAEFQELRLIFANANTRVLSGFEQSQQVERVQELLSQLKEQGMEFPGRMRDQVASACQISASKVARLKIIREKLKAPFLEQFADNLLSEQAAYALARLPEAVQEVVAGVAGKNPILGACAENLLTRHERYYEAESKQKCPDGQPCSNAVGMLKKTARAKYSWQYCYGQCCCECSAAHDCSGACTAAKQKAAKKKEHDKRKGETAAKKQQTSYEKNRMQTQQNALRLLKAVEAAGLDDTAKIKAQDYSYQPEVPVSELKKCAAGDFGDKIYYSPQFQMRGENAAALSRQLGCTTDYLLGLTDELTPLPAVVPPAQDEASPLPVIRWELHSNTPPIGELILTAQLTNEGPVLRPAVWGGTGFHVPGKPSKTLTGLHFTSWLRIPDLFSNAAMAVEPATVAGPDAVDWQTGADYPPGRWLVMLMDIGNQYPHRRLLYCDYSGTLRFSQWGNADTVADGFKILAWMPLPCAPDGLKLEALEDAEHGVYD